MLESSLRSIVNAVGKDKLTVRGSQVWQVRQGEGPGRSIKRQYYNNNMIVEGIILD